MTSLKAASKLRTAQIVDDEMAARIIDGAVVSGFVFKDNKIYAPSPDMPLNRLLERFIIEVARPKDK